MQKLSAEILYPAALKSLLLLLLVAALLATTGWFSPAAGQGGTVSVPGGSRAAAERAAVDLRQGMTLEEVQTLLGKPWRTTLTGSSGAPATPSLGTLRWTYTWVTSRSTSERNLNIDFAAKGVEKWTVTGWSWSNY